MIITSNEFSPKSVIVSYGRLMQFLANKRFGIIGNGSALEHIEEIHAVSSIIESLKRKHGIDIAGLTDTEEIWKCERVLSKELYDFAISNPAHPGVKDEVTAMSRAMLIDKTYFKRSAIGVDLEWYEKVCRFMSIRESALFRLCKKPSYIHRLEGDLGIEFYVLTCAYEHLRQESILLATVKQSHEHETYFVSTFFLLRKRDFRPYFDKPIHLFFQVLDRCGLNIQIGADTRRYFHKHPLAPRIIRRMDQRSIRQRIDERISVPGRACTDYHISYSYAFQGPSRAITLFNVFALDTNRILDDYRRAFRR